MSRRFLNPAAVYALAAAPLLMFSLSGCDEIAPAKPIPFQKLELLEDQADNIPVIRANRDGVSIVRFVDKERRNCVISSVDLPSDLKGDSSYVDVKIRKRENLTIYPSVNNLESKVLTVYVLGAQRPYSLSVKVSNRGEWNAITQIKVPECTTLTASKPETEDNQ